MQRPPEWSSTAPWSEADLDQHGSYLRPEFAHSLNYMIRDWSRLWCEAASDGAEARRQAVRAESAQARLAAWRCDGCAICPRSDVHAKDVAAHRADERVGHAVGSGDGVVATDAEHQGGLDLGNLLGVHGVEGGHLVQDEGGRHL